MLLVWRWWLCLYHELWATHPHLQREQLTELGHLWTGLVGHVEWEQWEDGEALAVHVYRHHAIGSLLLLCLLLLLRLLCLCCRIGHVHGGTDDIGARCLSTTGRSSSTTATAARRAIERRYRSGLRSRRCWTHLTSVVRSVARLHALRLWSSLPSLHIVARYALLLTARTRIRMITVALLVQLATVLAGQLVNLSLLGQ